MRNRLTVYGLAALSLIFIQASCKTGKVGGTADCPKTKVEQLEPIVRDSIQTKFDFLYTKIGVSVEDSKQSQSFKATVKMRPDSAFSGTVKVAGFSGAAYLVDQDTFAFKNSIKKCYKKESFQTMTDLFGTDVGYEFAQQLILGQAVGQQMIEKFFPLEDENYYVLGSHDRKAFQRMETFNLNDQEASEIFVKYFIACGTKKLARIEIYSPKDESRIEIDYLKRQEEEGLSFPQETNLKIVTNMDSTFIHLDYGSIKLNDPKRIVLNIPDSYSECE